MGQIGWELQDPVVSFMTIIPGLQAVRYELFNHYNVLWSNLRNMGAPLLANEVQTAPLFPLTLLLIALPQHLFWNSFILSRLLLMGAGSILIARQIFKFNRVGSLTFALVFIFNVYVCRWMNHPWQNGLTAGVWYIYFVGKTAESSLDSWGKQRFFLFLGTALSVYSLITCGFPEGAALSAVLTILAFAVPFVVQTYKKQLKIRNFLTDLFTSHLVGFGFAAIQLFSLLDYISHMTSFRTVVGTIQFDSVQIIWNLITPFNTTVPNGPIIHFFNLIPIFLFLWGLIFTIFRPKKLNRHDIAAFCAGLFYLLKLFPFWPAFNQFIGTLPVLKSCIFTVYFFPILLWFFSYFCGKGVHLIFSDEDSRREGNFVSNYLAALSILGFTLVIAMRAALESPKVNFDITTQTGLVFLLFLVLLTYLIQKNSRATIRSVPKFIFAPFILIALLVHEGNVSRHSRFLPFNGDTYKQIFNTEEIAKKIKQILNETGTSVLEVRERSPHASFSSAGIGGADNGAPAIQTDRSLALRTQLFTSDWGGLLPLTSETTPYSWRLTSSSYFIRGLPNFALHPKNSSKEFKGLKVLGRIKDDLYLLQDTLGLSRAYLASRCISATDMKIAVDLVKDRTHFQLGNAVLEHLSPSERIYCSGYNHSLQSVKILDDQGSRIKLDTVSGPAILLLDDSYYSGWEAFDRSTGNAIEIKPANINFRGLILPEKTSYSIEFQYRPLWLPWVYGLLLMSLLIIAFLGQKTYRSGRILS